MTTVPNPTQPRSIHQAPPPPRPHFAELAGGVLLTFAFTMLIVQWSLVRGKLAVFPPPRELAYANDALWRLRDFYGAGVGKLLSQWFESPPTSPLRSGMTLAAYAVLGIHDWAPYAANGTILLSTLILCNWLVARAAGLAAGGDLPSCAHRADLRTDHRHPSAGTACRPADGGRSNAACPAA